MFESPPLCSSRRRCVRVTAAVFESPPLCSSRCRCVRIVAPVLLLLVSPLLLLLLLLVSPVLSPVLPVLSPLALLIIPCPSARLTPPCPPACLALLLFIVLSHSSSSFALLSVPCSPSSSSLFPTVVVVVSRLIHVDPFGRCLWVSFRSSLSLPGSSVE
jgi:hypothetical protein